MENQNKTSLSKLGLLLSFSLLLFGVLSFYFPITYVDESVSVSISIIIILVGFSVSGMLLRKLLNLQPGLGIVSGGASALVMFAFGLFFYEQTQSFSCLSISAVAFTLLSYFFIFCSISCFIGLIYWYVQDIGKLLSSKLERQRNLVKYYLMILTQVSAIGLAIMQILDFFQDK